tara:strand:- start:845 stop:1060 length:216 start_codon:yes stop_codon:yes gene_type:complete
MKYFQTFKNKLLSLLGVKNQPELEFKKNRIDFTSIPDDTSERERLIIWAEALTKKGWTITYRDKLLDKLDK